MANNLTDESAIAMSEAMRMNSQLLELNMADNYITDVGAMALADVLRYNTNFHNINLNGNQITEEGAQELFEVLKDDDNALDTLYLFNNNVSNDLLSDIVQEMKRQMTPPEFLVPDGHLPADEYMQQRFGGDGNSDSDGDG